MACSLTGFDQLNASGAWVLRAEETIRAGKSLCIRVTGDDVQHLLSNMHGGNQNVAALLAAIPKDVLPAGIAVPAALSIASRLASVGAAGADLACVAIAALLAKMAGYQVFVCGRFPDSITDVAHAEAHVELISPNRRP